METVFNLQIWMKISADASQCHKMKKEKKQQQHVRLETGYRENI